MTAKTPQQLVDEFKKSGEFDRLRRELLNQFRNAEPMEPMLDRVRDIARHKLDRDREKLILMSGDAMYGELMQEMERYPFVERAVRDFSALCGGPDSQVRVSIKGTLTKLLEDDEESQGTGKTNGTSIPGVDVEEDMQQSDEDEAGRKG